MANRGLIIAGSSLMAATILIPTIVGAAGDGWDGFVFSIIFFFTVGPVLFITGLVLLIVGLASRRGQGQQQQQQVVVHIGAGGATPTVQVRCPKCSRMNPNASLFCGGCGQKLGRVAVR